MEKKSYGLLLPKKAKAFQPKAKSIFDSDSDENESTSRAGKKLPQKSFKVEAKHVIEDPNIYEYDSIYDSMKKTQTQKKAPAEIKKPKYMNSLLKAADKRKKDQERRVEKKIHSERLKEGDEFKDKEAFVTSAYKKKMQEMEEQEEKEKMKEKLDEMMDVTKQKDLSGFYRHLLNQTTGEEKVPEFGDTDKMVAENQESRQLNVTIKSEKKSDSSGSESEEEERHGTGRGKTSKNYESSDHKRSGRKPSEPTHSKQGKKNSSCGRHDSESSDEDTDAHSQAKECVVASERKSREDYKKSTQMKRKHLNESDSPMLKSMKHSENSSPSKPGSKSSENSDSDDDDQNPSEPDIDQKTGKIARSGSQIEPAENVGGGDDDDANLDADDDIVDSESEKSDEDRKKEPETDETVQQNKMSVKFVKRTVGEVFRQAQERYFRRMAAKNEGKNA